MNEWPLSGIDNEQLSVSSVGGTRLGLQYLELAANEQLLDNLQQRRNTKWFAQKCDMRELRSHNAAWVRRRNRPRNMQLIQSSANLERDLVFNLKIEDCRVYASHFDKP